MSTNIPGLQYPSITTSTDRQYIEIIRNIYDNLFYIRRALGEPRKLSPSQLRELEKTIGDQIITSITNNITNVGTGTLITGTHNLRLTVYGGASEPDGTGFFETDRNVVYVITPSPKKWEFAAGLTINTLVNRPVDLGIYDAGFLFFASDTEILSVWTGTAWVDVSTDVAAAGYWAPVTNGDPANPELIFDSLGNCVVSFTATP